MGAQSFDQQKGEAPKNTNGQWARVIAKIASDWSIMHGIEFLYIQPGKPTQNAFIERFNGSYRRGVLNKFIFENIDQVREQTKIWMDDYNNVRPHDALGNMSPVKYAQKRGVAAAGLILNKLVFMTRSLRKTNSF